MVGILLVLGAGLLALLPVKSPPVSGRTTGAAQAYLEPGQREINAA